jgi:hypothetical protein
MKMLLIIEACRKAIDRDNVFVLEIEGTLLVSEVLTRKVFTLILKN